MKKKKGKFEIGKIIVKKKQFGFIAETQIFISKQDLNDALDRDTVKYEIIEKDDLFINGDNSQKQAGRVVEIIQRYKDKFVVEIINASSKVIATFFDKKIHKTISITNHPNAFVGEMVYVQITSFNSNNFQGKFLKSLGHKDDQGVDIASIVCDLNISNEFSPEAHEEIAKISLLTEQLKKTKKFKDLTQKAFFTIDPTDSKDFDDSIFVESLPNNRIAVYVAIADVWSYLKHFPEIEKEAQARGNTYYLSNSVIPMLPFALSNNYCSLVEGEERNTLVAKFVLDEEGCISSKEIEIFPAIIKSQKRFTYDEVNEYFDDPSSKKDWSKEICQALDLSLKGYKLMDVQRSKKGYLNVDRHEHKFKYDEKNEIIETFLYKSGVAQKLIECYMVTANEIVANFFKEKQIDTLFRFHDKPKEEKITHFLDVCKEIKADNAGLSNKNCSVQKFNEIVKKNEKHPLFSILLTSLLHSTSKAVYDIKHSSHFNLNLENYLHFTSPIRRIADLIVHKLLWMLVFDAESYSSEDIQKTNESLFEIASTATESDGKASFAEDSINKRKIFKFLRKKYQNKYPAVVVSKNKYGFCAKIDGIFEVFIKSLENLKLGQKINIQYSEKNDEYSLLSTKQIW